MPLLPPIPSFLLFSASPSPSNGILVKPPLQIPKTTIATHPLPSAPTSPPATHPPSRPLLHPLAPSSHQDPAGTMVEYGVAQDEGFHSGEEVHAQLLNVVHHRHVGGGSRWPLAPRSWGRRLLIKEEHTLQRRARLTNTRRCWIAASRRPACEWCESDGGLASATMGGVKNGTECPIFST